MKNILLTLPHNVLPKCLSFIKVVRGHLPILILNRVNYNLKNLTCLEFSYFTIFHKKIHFKKFGKGKNLKFLAGFKLMTYSFAVW